MKYHSILFAFCLGCSQPADQPKFPDLQPVQGTVTRGGIAITGGGAIVFSPDPDAGEFLVNSEVGKDGTFSLSTVRTTDKKGERKVGAPAGVYKVTFNPPLGDQAAGSVQKPVDLPKPVTISTGENVIAIELPTKK